MMTLCDAISTISGEKQRNILALRSMMAEYPVALKALHLVDLEYTTPKKYKGYNLLRRDNKKLGFVYYVRYWHEGRMLRSKWCTHTNNYEKAREFAERNRDAIIQKYEKKHGNEVIKFFSKFYDRTSAIYQKEILRNGELSEGRQRRYQSVMECKFIPYLKDKKITAFEEITVPFLDDFQDALLGGYKERIDKRESFLEFAAGTGKTGRKKDAWLLRT